MAITESKGGQPPSPANHATPKDEIRLYSRSDIFYWWPVWTVGYLLALLT